MNLEPTTLTIDAPALKQLENNGIVLSEIRVNGQIFVSEATLFAAIQRVDELRKVLEEIANWPVIGHSPAHKGLRAISRMAEEVLEK